MALTCGELHVRERFRFGVYGAMYPKHKPKGYVSLYFLLDPQAAQASLERALLQRQASQT